MIAEAVRHLSLYYSLSEFTIGRVPSRRCWDGEFTIRSGEFTIVNPAKEELLAGEVRRFYHQV
eukprot:4804688-Pyramimonas_sp.AAC.1